MHLPQNLAKALEAAGGGDRGEILHAFCFLLILVFLFITLYPSGQKVNLGFFITSYGKVRMNFLTNPILCPGRKWQPTPVFLPGKYHGQRCLAGYGPWSCKEARLSAHTHFVSRLFVLLGLPNVGLP